MGYVSESVFCLNAFPNYPVGDGAFSDIPFRSDECGHVDCKYFVLTVSQVFILSATLLLDFEYDVI